jgi:hypothetical protein
MVMQRIGLKNSSAASSRHTSWRTFPWSEAIQAGFPESALPALPAPGAPQLQQDKAAGVYSSAASGIIAPDHGRKTNEALQDAGVF